MQAFSGYYISNYRARIQNYKKNKSFNSKILSLYHLLDKNIPCS